jgi:hypothetical protein
LVEELEGQSRIWLAKDRMNLNSLLRKVIGRSDRCSSAYRFAGTLLHGCPSRSLLACSWSSFLWQSAIKEVYRERYEELACRYFLTFIIIGVPYVLSVLPVMTMIRNVLSSSSRFGIWQRF